MKRHWPISAPGLLLAAALLGAAIWTGVRVRPSAEVARAFDIMRVHPATSAPDFALPTLTGSPVGLRDFRGQVVLLSFWATWCEPCREEMPAMNTLASDLGGQGLVLLAVNYQETPAQAAAFTRQLSLTAPILLDRDGAVAERYHVQGLPATFFIDRTGAVVGRVLGYRDWRLPSARAYVLELLAADG